MGIGRSIFVAQPDMTPAGWDAELAGTRIAREANTGDLYRMVTLTRHPRTGRHLSHAFMLALTFTEHQYGEDPDSIEVAFDTNSWGMRRSKADPAVEGRIIATARGQFVRYPNWAQSLDDCCFALTDPGFAYQVEGRETIATVIVRWSPNGDFDNNAERRMATVAAMMDRLAGPEQGAPMAPTILDVRADLPRNGAGGQRNNPGFMGFPAQVWPKQGAIVHYSGPAVDLKRDTLVILKGYAQYHIENTPEWGIAYHYDIGNDAQTRLLRDPADVLYHCGAWPYNATWFSVHVMLGEGQKADAAKLRALYALLEYLGAQCGYDPRQRVKGHQEVSLTACPGTLTGDFIVPYRAGAFKPGGTVSDLVKFPETGKGLRGAFRRYWEQTGGLRQHGFPLTDEVRERTEDGQERTVQYFERAVFEHHSDKAAAGYEVLERRIGATAAKVAGYSGPGI